MRRSGHGAAGGAGAAAAGESDPLPRGVCAEQPTPGLGDEGGSGQGCQTCAAGRVGLTRREQDW